MRSDVIVGVLVGLLTASSAPWWWDKVFAPKEASAGTPLTPPPTPPSTTTPGPPGTPLPLVPVPVVPPKPEPVRPELEDCKGKWYVQLGAGEDRGGIRGVRDKVRAADPEFEGATMFESTDGKYRAVLGCYERFEADRVNDKLVELRVLSHRPLTTQGKSLTRRVD